MDPLSDFISLLRPRNYLSGGLDFGAPWSIRFPRFEGIKCYAVMSGQCWLVVEGTPDAFRLEKGDCVLLSAGKPFQLASDMAAPAIDVRQLVTGAKNGGVIRWNGGGACFLVVGCFVLDGNQADMLLDTLPPVVHVRSTPDATALQWSLERMKHEVSIRRPGGSLMTQNLAYTILVEAIRLHLESPLTSGAGWLRGFADKRLRAAISAMHDDPARRWTLQALARRSGMSRTVFAVRFKHIVGLSVMDYLARWRMLLAADRLRNHAESAAEVAYSLGYGSESAFSRAFKRMMGSSPRQYSRGTMAAAAPHNKSTLALTRSRSTVHRRLPVALDP